MKLQSAIPAVIAKSGDLVERDVASNIELLQQALFTFGPIPERLNIIQISTNVLRSSFQTERFGHLTNPAGAINDTIARLGRGLWRLDLHAAYGGNFVIDLIAEAAAVLIAETPTATTFALWRAVNAGGATTNWGSTISHHITVDQDGYEIIYSLPAPPAAGNFHSLAVQLQGAKLL